MLIGSSYFIISCAQSNSSEKTNKLDGHTILKECIKHHGGLLFNSSEISLKVKDVNYKMINYEHKVKYTMEKLFKDGLHVVTYDRGQVQYFKDDTLREGSSYNNLIVNARLEKFLYALSIPFNLTFNGTKARRLEDVKIRSKNYYTILITFTKLEGIPENQFILYIDQSNYQMEFLALDYNLLGGPISFRKFINPRRIHDVLFQDFISFTSSNESKLKDLYKEYNSATLKSNKPTLLKEISFSSISKNPFW